MNCKNCKNPVDGNYCKNCGQALKVDRITFARLLEETSESILQINRGLFFTLKELSLRPGHMLQEFLDGQRKNHFKPIAYLLTLSTIYFIITQFTQQNTWLADFFSGWKEGASESDENLNGIAIISWVSKNYAYTTVLLVPIFSVASFLSFWKLGYNYMEHVVINAYITGHEAIIYSLFTMLGVFYPNYYLALFSFICSISYTWWVYRQFFQKHSWVWVTFRTLLTYLIFVILGTGMMLIGME